MSFPSAVRKGHYIVQYLTSMPEDSKRELYASNISQYGCLPLLINCE